MHTLTHHRSDHRALFSKTSHAIGADSENVAFNMPKRAYKVLNDFLRGRNRSAKIRQYIAEGMQREDTWFGLAFRAAIGLKNFTVSIFVSVPKNAPAEVVIKQAEAWQAQIPALQAKCQEAKGNADKVTDGAVEEIADESKWQDTPKGM